MFPLARRSARLVRLLAVLWAVGRCEASQFAANVAISQDQLLRLIVQDVKSEIQPLFNMLASRIEGLDSRLIGIEARLNSLDFKQDKFDSRLDELVSQAASMDDRIDSRLEELVSRVNSTENGFDSGLNELVSRANSTNDKFNFGLEDLVSRVNSTNDKLESRLGPLPRDCSDLETGARTGVHLLLPSLNRSQSPVAAFCDMDKDGGGWTVIQRRADIKPRQDFFLDWAAYREGFGELDAEFWWGLENMWTMTGPQDRQYELRVNLGDFEGERRHATYGQFRVASEAAGYRLLVANYTGDAGDCLGSHSGQKFSTRDKDHDGSSTGRCAQVFKGAWWYSSCYDANLNGQYLIGPQADPQAGYGSVVWRDWKGLLYSLKDVEMKIRPVDTI